MMLFRQFYTIGSNSYKVSYSVLKNIRRYSQGVPNNFKETSQNTNDKILYNTIIDSRTRVSYIKKVKMRKELDRVKLKAQNIQPLPLSLKYVVQECSTIDNDKEQQSKVEIVEKSQSPTQFPYNTSETEYYFKENKVETQQIEDLDDIEVEIRERYRKLKDMNNWMTAYDNFEFDLAEVEEEKLHTESVNYGTPDPNSTISNVPCGGCGALLHCKDTAIPGYIPSEIFKNCHKNGAATLKSITCQRCFFLKEYNVALRVQVHPKDYFEIINALPKDKRQLIVLIVDLLDFPCSIWPGIADMLGTQASVYVVGNKVDLLPRDDKTFLKNIKERLKDQLKLNGFGASNILGVSLISAKTGYGVEDLITDLFRFSRKGNVYLIGCTNVGKSSLFNALIQSDFCKSQASDLIQRATVSQWPGTTLNLLKFPIFRVSPERLLIRQHRLKALQKTVDAELKARGDQLKKSDSVEHATLIGYIGQSFREVPSEVETQDLFSTRGNRNESGKTILGINEKDKDYVMSRWCYDTPGVMQPDQILNLLTADELMLALPRELIRPETFSLHPGATLFIAGLARLDYLEGSKFIRVTVFRSNALPITVCYTSEADEVYRENLGTDYFKVPINIGDRITKWPGLKPSHILTFSCPNKKESAKDIVLSNAGWIAINSNFPNENKFRAWTPEGRGIYLRDCLLPKAIHLRGKKIRGSVAYEKHRLI